VLKAAAAISRLPLISIAAAHGAVALVVTPAAVWRPPPGFMTGFHARCDAVRGAAFDACFAAAMGTAWGVAGSTRFHPAPRQQGLSRGAFATGGAVAVAHIAYPFRANENDMWLFGQRQAAADRCRRAAVFGLRAAR
jgi:hypothetical protein